MSLGVLGLATALSVLARLGVLFRGSFFFLGREFLVARLALDGLRVAIGLFLSSGPLGLLRFVLLLVILVLDLQLLVAFFR